jgi:hypothetical protein
VKHKTEMAFKNAEEIKDEWSKLLDPSNDFKKLSKCR